MEWSEPLQGPETPTDVAESEDLEKLESEVKEMSEKILHYRATLPDKLKTTFASVLAAQRPVLPDRSEPGNSEVPNSDPERITSSIPTNGDQETLEKIRLLKEKISRNASTMPVVLKRMRECLSKIDKLDSQNLIIHPAFKRKRTT